jgi:hypothetical protein
LSSLLPYEVDLLLPTSLFVVVRTFINILLAILQHYRFRFGPRSGPARRRYPERDCQRHRAREKGQHHLPEQQEKASSALPVFCRAPTPLTRKRRASRNSHEPTSRSMHTSQVSGQRPRREDLLRMDYNATQNFRVFGHHINNLQPVVNVYGSFLLGENVPLAPIQVPISGYSFAGGATYVVSPTMTNEFNMGITKNTIDIFETGKVLTRTSSRVTLPLLYPNAVCRTITFRRTT